MNHRILSAAILLLLCAVQVRAAEDLPSSGVTAQSRQGMVVTVSREASEIGRATLNQGGNGVDAAVAVGLALAVTWPEAGNLGGGGFMLVHPGPHQPPVFIDYREQAPAATTADMFTKGIGSPHREVGVPGTVRGLKLAHERFGRLPWKSLVLPAIDLAQNGFLLGPELAKTLNEVLETSGEFPEFLRVYGKDAGKGRWKQGDRLLQPDLAATLKSLADEGAEGFYHGRLAELLVAEMQQGGGLITISDLANYQAKIRTPIHGRYRGYDIFSAPPPSSGGTVLVQMLNTVENFDLRQQGRWSPRTLHLMAESMRRAYYDRARYLGDPDFTPIPEHLTTKEYAAQLAKGISLTTATPSATLGAEILMRDEGTQTTHFSIIDGEGMAVANTYTLEESFGSRVVVRGAGYLLNNEMGDFNPKPGITNSQGLIGTKPNLAEPGKRMLSSMTPVIVTKEGIPVLITGSPGGRTIINTMFCLLVNHLEYQLPPRETVDAPRFHHPWMPDIVTMEGPLWQQHETEIQRLRTAGHTIAPKPIRQGDAHSIFISTETGLRLGIADKRRDGWGAGQ